MSEHRPALAHDNVVHAPVVLDANLPERFYRGGAAIARFRGIEQVSEFTPEDWMASATTLFGEAEAGLTRLPGGPLLRDALVADPLGWLGEEHLETYGASPALLVKLLDAGQRLPVHAHPSREWARRHLDCPYGKTEAWVIVECEPDARVHLGFRRDVEADELAGWVERQDEQALIGSLHSVPVRPGDSVLVPAGVPHAVGAGIFLIELQEPTDLSVLMEWGAFELDGRADGHLGLGFDVALGCVDRSAFGADRLRELRAARDAGRELRPGTQGLFPRESERFFRAERLRPPPALELEASFSLLVVVEGDGELQTAAGTLALRRGMTVLLPYAAGGAELRGTLEVLRCLPPAPRRAHA
jgi:mannose-6-phosphate isomerase